VSLNIMAKIQLTKEEVQRIAKIKGNVSGTILKAYYDFIVDHIGEDGAKKIEERLTNLGCPIKFKEAFSFKWYPKAYSSLICMAFLEIAGWDEKRAFEVGYDAPAYSVLTKLLMKYFSIERILKESPRHWRQHFDFADMKCVEYKPEEKCAILRLNGFKKFHPTVYFYIWGYLTRLIEMATKGKEVKVEQTKSLYNNDPYDEFKIIWE
jgi:hypothetical protein